MVEDAHGDGVETSVDLENTMQFVLGKVSEDVIQDLDGNFEGMRLRLLMVHGHGRLCSLTPMVAQYRGSVKHVRRSKYYWV
jgi:hypothetical protein